jgi:hypothetical protein
MVGDDRQGNVNQAGHDGRDSKIDLCGREMQREAAAVARG